MGYNVKEITYKRLYKWMQGIPQPPVRLNLLPTEICNLDCKMCGGPAVRNSGELDFDAEMTKEQWIPIIKEAAKMGVVDWWINGGGEPMTRPDVILTILEIIKKTDKNYEIELTSNGTLWTDDIIKRVFKTGVDKIQFSIDGPDAKTHDFIRGFKGTFDKVTNSVRSMANLKKKYKKKKPYLLINCVLNQHNYNRQDEMVEMAHRLGANAMTLTPMRLTKDSMKKAEDGKMRLNSKQKKEVYGYYEKARKQAEKYNIFYDCLVNEGQEEIVETKEDKIFKADKKVAPKPEKEVKKEKLHPFLNLRCYEPWYSMSIDRLGNPGTCVTCAIGNPKYSLKKHTFKEVWYGGFFPDIRKRLFENKYIKICSHCTVTDMRIKCRNELIEYVQKVEKLKKLKKTKGKNKK